MSINLLRIYKIMVKKIKKFVTPLLMIPLFFFFGNIKAIEIYNENNNTVSIDGKMQTAYLLSQDKMNTGDFSSFHLGFKLESKLTNHIFSYARWQHHFINKPYESRFGSLENNTHLAYVGLKYKQLGAFDYGRNIGLINKTLSITDVLQKINTPYNRRNVFLAGSALSLYTYHNKNFFGLIDGLNFNLQYQGKNHLFVNRSSALEVNGPGYAVFASYKYHNFTLCGSYANVKRLDLQNKLRYGKSKRAELWATGMKYDSKSIYVAATYNENSYATPVNDGFSNKTNSIEMSLQGKLLNSTLKPILSYVFTQSQSIDNIPHKINLVKYIAVGTTYNLSKNFNIYAEYKFNLLNKRTDSVQISDLKIPRSNVAALGFNYYF